MPRVARSYLLLFASVCTIAAAMWVVARVERSTHERNDRQAKSAQKLLIAMLDQETGLRGYLLTGRDAFPRAQAPGRVRDHWPHSRRARDSSGRDAAAQITIDAQALAAARWSSLAQVQIDRVPANDRPTIDVRAALERKTYMNRFRAANARFQTLIDRRYRDSVACAGWIQVLVVLGVSCGFLLLGYLLIWRGAKESRGRSERDRLYAETQSEFIETMQVTGSPEEAQTLLGRHLERSLPGSTVVVFNRNNSENRLKAATPVEEDSPLTATLQDAEPRSCLAIRLGRAYVRGDSAEPLLECTVCGHLPGAGACLGKGRDTVHCQPAGVLGDAARLPSGCFPLYSQCRFTIALVS